MAGRYVAGVNAWIETRDAENRLPFEFAVLGFTPRAWTLEDVATVALYQTWYAHDLSDQDAVYERLARAAGPTAGRVLRAGFAGSRATVAATPSVPPPPRMTGGSNSWAVAPSRSRSGFALHAADPHLEINGAPGFWYAAALHSAEGTDLVGVTAPGLPSLAMGHNGHIAWSFTVAAVDVADYFRVRRSPSDSLMIEDIGGWTRVEVIEETLRVAGEEEARLVRIEVTPRGPIVEYDSIGGIALQWAGNDLPSSAVLDNAVRIHRARRFDQFRRAAAGLGALDVNWVFSARDGHIGYQLGSPVPVRTDSIASFAMREAAAGPSWSGFRPLADTPFVLDPASGWVASCNNRPVPDGWPYELPGFYDPYRIARISGLLDSQASFDTRDMERFQMDIASERANRWKELAAQGALRIGDEALADAFGEWDAVMDREDTLATVFALWWHHLTPALFADETGPDGWRGAGDLQEAVLTDTVVSLIDDRRTPGIEDAVDISARAMETARREAAGRRWGVVHTLTIRHPLARAAVLDRSLGLSRGPFAWEGDATSLAAAFSLFDRATSTFPVDAGPSMRFVMDWSNPDAFTLTPALGQSGHPHSPHFADFLELSRTGRRWTVPLTRAAADARRASLLRLLPA
jgi:penicillin amidase